MNQTIEKFEIERSSKFQQANDPRHTVQKMKLWLPELNIIGNLLSQSDNEVVNMKLQVKINCKLKMAKRSKISAEYYLKLVKSFLKRLKDVLRNKGHPTHYKTKCKVEIFK